MIRSAPLPLPHSPHGRGRHGEEGGGRRRRGSNKEGVVVSEAEACWSPIDGCTRLVLPPPSLPARPHIISFVLFTFNYIPQTHYWSAEHTMEAQSGAQNQCLCAEEG